MKKFDKEFIEKNLAEGYITKQKHPEYPLWIFNYTQKTQYEKKWCDKMVYVRGLVLDEEYNVIAGGLKKFFNYQELDKLPEGEFEVLEKYDGSLILVFMYKGDLIVSSKGSFTSDQALKAKEMLTKKYHVDFITFYKDYTYYFEIIYPENRIVVRYNEEKLVFLAAFVNLEEATYMFKIPISNIPVAKSYDFKNVTEVVKFNKDNFEGFVIKWKDGTRCKVKLEEYVRLHRVMTGFSSREILEFVSEDKDLTPILEGVPDEFYNWVRQVVSDAKDKHWKITKDAEETRVSIYIDLLDEHDGDNYSQKDFALAVQASGFRYPGLLYKLERSQDINKDVWRIIKKEADYTQPFKDKI